MIDQRGGKGERVFVGKFSTDFDWKRAQLIDSVSERAAARAMRLVTYSLVHRVPALGLL